MATATASLEPVVEEVAPEAEEVVVTGSRTREKLIDTTVATELISKSEIQDSGAENLTELLEEQPGVELERSTRGTGIRLMGLDPEHVLILVDGDRVTGRVGGGIDPSRFILDNVQQIEIVKGAGSAIYGSEAIGGVVNIITRRPTKPLELSIDATYGMFNTFDASATAGGRYGPVSSIISGGFHRTDGFVLEADEGERENLQTNGPRADGWDVSNTTIFDLSDDVSLRVRGDYSALKQEAGDQLGSIVARREQLQSTYSAVVSPEVRFGDAGLFKSSLSFSHFDFDIEQEAEAARDEILQTIGQLTMQIDDEVLENHMVSVGLEAILEFQGGTSSSEVEGMRVTRDFFEGGTKDRQRAAIYMQDDWTPVDDDFFISVVPSIRVDIDSQFGSVASPRFAVRYDPISEIALRMSYGLGFRAPTFEDLYLDFINRGNNYLVRGNDELEPERSQAFNLTGTVRPWEWISATGTFYYINLENLIDTINVGRSNEGLTVFQYVNVESARSTGVEGSLDFSPIKQLSIGLGYVFNATRDRATDLPLSGRSRHKGTVKIGFRSEEWGLYAMLRSQIYGPRIFVRDDDGDGVMERIPRDTYATLDFRVEKTLFDWLGLYAGFENLLDQGDPLFTPITPRSFYGGISAHYELDQEVRP